MKKARSSFHIGLDNDFIGRYKIVSVIKDDGGVKVMEAIYFKNLWFRRCIIKTSGMTGTGVHIASHARRLEWQFRVHQQLSAQLPIAEAIEAFELQSNYYIVLGYVKGDNLQTVIDRLYNGMCFKELELVDKCALLQYGVAAVQLVKELHELGFVHRDISGSNFIVNKNGLHLVDMEQCWSCTNNVGIVFPSHTKGYSSPQQVLNMRPAIQDDVYSLGCLMIPLFVNVHPSKMPLKFPGRVAEALERQIISLEFVDIVVRCIDPNPRVRPCIEELEQALVKMKSLFLSKYK